MWKPCVIILFLAVSTIAATIARADNVPRHDRLDTRLGTVEVLRRTFKDGEDIVNGEPDSVQVNGRTVFRAPSLYIGLYESFDLGGIVVVLFGVNQGGSATPNDHLHFLVLKAGQKPKTITTKNFVSADGTIMPRVNSSEVQIALGFDGKRSKIARLRGGQLAIEYTKRLPPSPMPEEDCEWLYEYSTLECIEDTRTYKMKCESFAAGYSGSSVAVMTGITSLKNHPGFISSALERVCLQECKTGNKPALQDFKRDVCSIK